MTEPRLPSPEGSAQLGPYPAYKDSGVDWLGEIPAHWDVRRLKSLCRRCAVYGANVSATSYSATGVRFLRTTDITESGGIREGGVSVSPALVGEYLLEDGDLLLSRSGTIGRSFLYADREHGPCAYAGYLVRFVLDSSVVPEYAFFFTKTRAFFDFLRVMAISSTIDNVNGEKYANCQVPLPSVGEQRGIADFLKSETDLIDTLIGKNEELIRRLREKRTALISQTVTKGLDTGIPMRDPGVEWLGDIPAHWRLQRLKTISEMKSGESITAASIDANGQYPVFGGHGLRGYTTDFTHEGEHVLIGRQGAHCGNIQTARGRFWASEHAVVVSPHRPNVLEWLEAVLEAMDLNQHSVAAAQPGLAVDRLRDLQIPVPPTEEQGAIAVAVRRETSRIDALIAKVNEGIDRLNGYRAALISAAVTGKIDVRKCRHRQVADHIYQPEAAS